MTTVGPHNLFVRAEGTVGLVQSALGVEVHQYRLKDMTFRASPTEATLPPAIAPLVASVSGLSSLAPMPNIAHAVVGLRSQTSRVKTTPRACAPIHQVGGRCQRWLLRAVFPCLRPASASAAAESAQLNPAMLRSTSETPRGRLHHAAISRRRANRLQHEPLYKVGLDGPAKPSPSSTRSARPPSSGYAAFSRSWVCRHVTSVIGTPTESISRRANAGWATETTLDVGGYIPLRRARIVLIVTPATALTTCLPGV